MLFASVVCDQVHQVDQVFPAHQVDDIDEVHELDPVHQVDKDEHTEDDGRQKRPKYPPPKKVKKLTEPDLNFCFTIFEKFWGSRFDPKTLSVVLLVVVPEFGRGSVLTQFSGFTTWLEMFKIAGKVKNKSANEAQFKSQFEPRFQTNTMIMADAGR